METTPVNVIIGSLSILAIAGVILWLVSKRPAPSDELAKARAKKAFEYDCDTMKYWDLEMEEPTKVNKA